MKTRNVILGLDGVPFQLMKDLSNKDIMPNFKDLSKEFTFRKMQSSIPHISSVSWSSIITGQNPGEHGIFGFTDIIENTYSLRFPNFNALKSKPFWQKDPNKTSVIINVPSTYPAKELNGIHISGFISLDLEKAVYPREYISKLKNLNYEIDIDSKLAHQQSKNVFIDELFRVLDIRKKTFDILWNEFKWDNFMPVITGTDRFGHFLWHIYENKSNEYHHRIIQYFKKIDNIIGELYKKLNENDTFIILSDHGMERINKSVNLNTFLHKEGYLDLSDDFKRYNRITKKTKAFILDPGRVYLNKKNKYPNGSVLKNEEKSILENLKTLFYDLKFENYRVIKKVYEKEEIYSGKMINNAPDLVIVENNGFQPKGAIGKTELFEEDIFSGKHNDSAFIFINRDINIHKPSVEDVIGLLR